MEGLSLSNIHKTYEETTALDGISFHISPGEIVALIGPSGCGKSTLLSIIAGLETPDKGELFWDDSSLSSIPPHRRNFGLMFQDNALFPHRNVLQNVAFGLQMKRIPKDDIQERVREGLELVGLPGFEQRDVNTLSGGEEQRVALARSLITQPLLLMLDEPLGSLDRNLRERLAFDLRHILHDSGQTTLYVTHDQEEAFVLADQIVIMNAGKVEQIGSPLDIYHNPKSIFVARFLGMTNIIPAQIHPDQGRQWAQTQIGVFPVINDYTGAARILLRPDAVSITDIEECQIAGEVIEITFRGSVCRVVIQINDISLNFELPSNITIPPPGSQIHLCFNPEKAIQIFPQ